MSKEALCKVKDFLEKGNTGSTVFLKKFTSMEIIQNSINHTLPVLYNHYSV